MNRDIVAKAVGRDMKWVLADDVRIVSLSAFPSDVRRRLLRGKKSQMESRFVIHRPQSRSDPKAVNDALRRILRRFKKPATFLQVVIESAAAEKDDPFITLRRLKPAVKRLVSSGILVRADRPGDDLLRKIEPTLLSGSRFGGFKILACMSTTIDSEVYQVESAGQRLVLKLCRPRFSLDNTRRRAHRQLASEIAVAKALDGSAACRLVARGVSGGRAYAAFEWIDGPDIDRHARLLRKTGGRSQLLTLCCDLLDALSSIHDRGYVHGDIHPRNFIVESGRARVIDFGLSCKLGRGAYSCGFSGVFQYLPPEAAAAFLAGRRTFRRSRRSELYSTAALLYRLLAGRHYIRAGTTKKETAALIRSGNIRQVGWPELQPIFDKALAKKSSARYSSLKAFRDALARAGHLRKVKIKVKADTKALERLQLYVDDYLEELRPLTYNSLPLLQKAPYAAVAHGGAGVASALLRAAQHRDEPDLLALASNWIDQSLAALGREDALYDDGKEFTRDRVGDCSLPFSTLGLKVVQVQIARAQDAAMIEEAALRGIAACFAKRNQAPLLDLFLGAPGLLLASSLLHAEKPGPSTLTWGTVVAKSILSARGPEPGPAWDEVKSIGLAHGWAGLYYSLLQWSLVSGAALPVWVAGGLHRLVDCAVTTRHGLDWPMRRAADQPEFMNSLCNGAPGLAMTFALAYERYRDGLFLEAARAAGRRAMGPGSPIGHLCCGAVGRAYGLLAVDRIDPSGPWRSAAVRCAVESLVWRDRSDSPHGLLKGQGGNLCLALDLLSNEKAACPILEIA